MVVRIQHYVKLPLCCATNYQWDGCASKLDFPGAILRLGDAPNTELGENQTTFLQSLQFSFGRDAGIRQCFWCKFPIRDTPF